MTLLEADLELNRKELNRLVQQEHDFYLLELQKIKGEHSNAMNILVERNNLQAKEISELQVIEKNPILFHCFIFFFTM